MTEAAFDGYTEIDPRCYSAIVKNGYVSEVLLALLLDPLEAEDYAEWILERKEATVTVDVEGRPLEAPIKLSDFQSLPSKDSFEKLKITLSQWVMTTEDASFAIRQIALWDKRFGVWCACQIARSVLVYLPDRETRPLAAIKTAESWVTGRLLAETSRMRRSVESQLFEAEEAAEKACAETLFSVSRSAVSCTRAARNASSFQDNELTAKSCGYAATYAAEAFADSVSTMGTVAWLQNRAKEMIRLRDVLAASCLTFPG